LLAQLNVRYVLSDIPITAEGFTLVIPGQPAVYQVQDWQPRISITPEGTYTLLNRHPGEYQLSVTARDKAFLVVRETWLPGWKAVIDGEYQTTEQVPPAFIGVQVPPGIHTVNIIYQPDSWRIGSMVSLITLLLLFLWIIVFIWRANKKNRI